MSQPALIVRVVWPYSRWVNDSDFFLGYRILHFDVGNGLVHYDLP